jgi:hypothetical protein
MTDRQTDRQTDIQTDRQKERQTGSILKSEEVRQTKINVCVVNEFKK